ncbi:MAG: UvrD-helicase domain-containing protein, partial [Bacteroidales bacterium]|nr:UvrD-helicase domain-containing protein [Bacteroidales bacterium]
MIKITKASAGSGKTYTLAKHYITLLLGDRRKDAFRHILAVTFTNKATEEMKRRIIKELHILAADTVESDYFKDFVPALFPDAASLGKKSAEVLSAILNDYGSFAVSTIDKFFQSTLRAFSREIGQLASYKVELDRDSLIREAVGRLLDSLTAESKNEPVLKWLSENAVSLAEDGERAKYDKKLEEYALKLYGQQFRSELEKAGLAEEDFLDPGKISTTKEYCKDFCSKYIGSIETASKKVKDEFASSGIPQTAVSNYPTSIGAIETWTAFDSRGSLRKPGTRILHLGGDSSSWFKARNVYPVPAELQTAVDDFIAIFDEKNISAYKTVCLIEKQFYGLGLAKAIKDEF